MADHTMTRDDQSHQLTHRCTHRRRLLEQRTVRNREVAADHAAVTIDQAVGDAVHMLVEPSQRW